MRMALEIGAVRLAPHYHLIGQHLAQRCEEGRGGVLLPERHRQPTGLERRNTLQVVALASRPLSEMTSCLAPSPAVMSSLETSATRSAEPLSRWIFLVLPSLRTAPSVNFEEWVVLASKA